MLNRHHDITDQNFSWLNDEEDIHAVGEPAKMCVAGRLFWMQDSVYHRVDGPAITYADGKEEWYLHGKRHRVNGPAKIKLHKEEWYLNGKLHRDDGPATTSRSFQTWHRNGKLHRDNGKPAMIHADGRKEWWVDGVRVPPSPYKLVAFLKTMLMKTECVARRITNTPVASVQVQYRTMSEMLKKYPHKDML